MTRPAMDDKARAHLLATAARHQRVADELRELADLGWPGDATMETAPVLHGWRWDAELKPTLRGTWRRDGEPGIVDGSVGSVVANLPDLSAVLTLGGWFILGVPDDARAPTTEVVQ